MFIASWTFPPTIIYLTLLIGIPLALNKPFGTFLGVLFLSYAVNLDVLTFSRLPYLGRFFNMNDVLLIIAISTLLPIIKNPNEKTKIPLSVLTISSILLITFIISLLQFGFDTDFVRGLRWALAFPIYLLISANIVDTPQKVSLFILTLIFAIAIASLSHIVFVIDVILSDFNSIADLRNVKFGLNVVGLFAVFLLYIFNREFGKKWIIYFLIFQIVLLSVVLNQVRSIWLAMIITILIMVGLSIWRSNPILRPNLSTILLTGLAIVIISIALFLFLNINLANPFISRVTASESVEYRANSIEYELDAWQNSNLVFGRGLSYWNRLYPEVTAPPDKSCQICFGHLGHLTTLAQVGLAGYVLYYIIVPIQTFQYSTILISSHHREYQNLAILGYLVILYLWILMLFTSSFLADPQIMTGAILGTIWINGKNYLLKNPS